MKKSSILFGLLAFVVMSSIVAASPGGIANLQTALTNLCSDIKSLIPIVSFLMIIAAGVIYASGQLLGAETRARASVWATAMIVGAFIGLVIVVITPGLLSTLYGSATTEFSC